MDELVVGVLSMGELSVHALRHVCRNYIQLHCVWVNKLIQFMMLFNYALHCRVTYLYDIRVVVATVPIFFCLAVNSQSSIFSLSLLIIYSNLHIKHQTWDQCYFIQSFIYCEYNMTHCAVLWEQNILVWYLLHAMDSNIKYMYKVEILQRINLTCDGIMRRSRIYLYTMPTVGRHLTKWEAWNPRHIRYCHCHINLGTPFLMLIRIVLLEMEPFTWLTELLWLCIFLFSRWGTVKLLKIWLYLDDLSDCLSLKAFCRNCRSVPLFIISRGQYRLIEPNRVPLHICLIIEISDKRLGVNV